MAKIIKIAADKILDSRGDWTVQTHLFLDDGAVGLGEVPSGISTGQNEAALLPVDQALKSINDEIAKTLLGFEVTEQQKIDQTLIGLDGTENKSRLGANAILAISLAASDAGAKSRQQPLYLYLADNFGQDGNTFNLPHPMFLLIEGGKHAPSERDFQEYMITCTQTENFNEELETAVMIYRTLREFLDQQSLSTAVGVEGGFSPQQVNTLEAFNVIQEAIVRAGFNADQIKICLDVAANSLVFGEIYKLAGINQVKSGQQLQTLYGDLKSQFSNLLSIEDPFSENDFDLWKDLKTNLPETLIVADDLTTTNPRRLPELIEKQLFNAVIIKPNQIGSLTETFAFAKIAKENDLKLVVSHRAGETSSSFIADLAVALGADFVKFGAPARGERVAKYNRLLEIAREIYST